MSSDPMTDPTVPPLQRPEDLIAAVARGERIRPKHSIHAEASGTHCQSIGFNHNWRTIVCTSDRDVVECSRCGDQQITACNFDEEYS